jgi:sugar/nucleoside kinase (ribokinase family)
VRQVDPETREVRFRDPADKETLVGLLDRVKLDIVEAKIMTGSDDIGEAAAIVQSWGSPEVMITQSAGVLLRIGDATHYEPFSNRSIVGRTGRGDTTFAAYLSRRREYGPAESLKFAAALVSIKMETPGPFRGTLSQVLTRMKEAHHA